MARNPTARSLKWREILDDPRRNTGTAFSPEERQALGLEGLLDKPEH
ncbi:hypothetical protein [Methylobacterium sp. Leaf123]|nr:hypothetical protein [Methylobacterium sp. Leaf123]